MIIIIKHQYNLVFIIQLHVYIYPYYYLQSNWELFNTLLFLKYAV